MSLSANLRHFDMLSRCFKTAARRVPPQIEKMALSSSTLDAAKPCKTFQAMQEREERANSKIENQEIIFFSQSSAIFLLSCFVRVRDVGVSTETFFGFGTKGPAAFTGPRRLRSWSGSSNSKLIGDEKKHGLFWICLVFHLVYIHSFSSCGPTMSDNRRHFQIFSGEERRLTNSYTQKLIHGVRGLNAAKWPIFHNLRMNLVESCWIMLNLFQTVRASVAKECSSSKLTCKPIKAQERNANETLRQNTNKAWPKRWQSTQCKDSNWTTTNCCKA